MSDASAKEAPTKQVMMPLAKAVGEAGRLFSAGQFAKAENLARQISKHHPNNADALNILGVALNAQGKPKDAVATLTQAIKRAPKNGIFYANLGEIERQRGRHVEARQALEKAVQLAPNNASAHNNLGILHFEKGEYPAAAAAYKKAIQANPAFAEAYNNLGNVSRFIGEADKALGYYHKALQHRERYPEAYNNLGSLLRDQGKFPEAEHAYKKAMMQSPAYIEAFNNLANLYFIMNRDPEALRVLGDALRIQDNHPITLTITARVQLRRGNFEAAEQAARRALAANPKSADALVALGQIFHETDRYEEAIGVLEKAVELAPKSSEALNFYGVALKSVGRLEEGKTQILKAVEINPQSYGAYANLNDVVDFSEAPELVANMEAIFAGSQNPDDPRLMALHFGFGKALDDIGQHERALEHYTKGAMLKRKQLTYSEEETFGFFRDIKTVFDAAKFTDRPFKGMSSDRPIFIVGMPRSGSTLVEQILSAHSQVFGAGEIKHLARAIGQMRDRFPSMSRYPVMISEMEDFHYETLGNSYLKQIEPMAGDAKKVTDKLLTNYFFVGLINLIFPKAKIIHTVRNPVDTCLSAYTKLFKDDMPHSYDFGELGRYYREYRSLMEHWHKVLPKGVLMDVSYEEVVGDIEGNARRLIEFVGLEWDPACVDFHRSSRPVKTASVAQVRKPVYSGSVDRWKKYGAGLQPLIEAIEGKPAGKSSGKPDRKTKAKAEENA